MRNYQEWERDAPSSVASLALVARALETTPDYLLGLARGPGRSNNSAWSIERLTQRVDDLESVVETMRVFLIDSVAVGDAADALIAAELSPPNSEATDRSS